MNNNTRKAWGSARSWGEFLLLPWIPSTGAQKPPPWEQSITRYISTFSLKSLSPWKSQAINNPLIPLSGPNSFLLPAPPFPACPHSRGGASTECLPLTSQAHISELRQELPGCLGAPGTRSPPLLLAARPNSVRGRRNSAALGAGVPACTAPRQETHGPQEDLGTSALKSLRAFLISALLWRSLGSISQ